MTKTLLPASTCQKNPQQQHQLISSLFLTIPYSELVRTKLLQLHIMHQPLIMYEAALFCEICYH